MKRGLGTLHGDGRCRYGRHQGVSRYRPCASTLEVIEDERIAQKIFWGRVNDFLNLFSHDGSWILTAEEHEETRA